MVVLTFSGKNSDWSALGSLVWLACRLAHAGFFVAEITGWRTWAYLGSLVGLAMMLLTLAL